MPPDTNTPPAKRRPLGDPTVHALVVALSLVCLFVGFFIAAIAGGSPGLLLWTLALPVIGVLIAVTDRQWVALVPHGTVVALNLVFILPL